mgnify:CR=1 FL=1
MGSMMTNDACHNRYAWAILQYNPNGCWELVGDKNLTPDGMVLPGGGVLFESRDAARTAAKKIDKMKSKECRITRVCVSITISGGIECIIPNVTSCS